MPNIAIYNWEHDADVEFVSRTEDDLRVITSHGKTHGSHLANWLQAQADAGLIDPSAPLHLIGHSAGGFVMGQAGCDLSPAIKVDRVTLLDTPLPVNAHISGLQAGGTHIDRLITSFYGHRERLGWPETFPDLYTEEYYRSKWGSAVEFSFGEDGHGLAYRRYEDTATTSDPDYLTTSGVSFYYSPVISGPRNLERSGAALRKPRGPKSPPPGEEEVPLGPLTGYGSTAHAAGTYTLTEILPTDSGIFAQVEIPVGAHSISFSYRFSGGDEDDRLVATAGESVVPVVVPDLPLYRSRDFRGYLDVAALGGSTVTLDLRLEGTGAANASLFISDLKFLISADVDQDGIANTAELAAGSDPLNPDSDGDGLADGDELNGFGTEVTQADSDGDGVSDDLELAAGTNPLSASSIFRLTAVPLPGSGDIQLLLQGSPDRSYRVRASTEPFGATNWTIHTGIRPWQGSAVLTDSQRRNNSPKFFYWAEVETTE